MSNTTTNKIDIVSFDYNQLCEQLKLNDATNKNMLDFIYDVFISSKERHLFWGNTDFFKSKKSNDLELKYDFLNSLRSNWGDFRFFILNLDYRPSGILAIYNVSFANKRAEILAWLESEYRSKNVFIKWWILFIYQLQILEIKRIFAKVRQQNLTAIQATKRFGFEQCGVFPEYFKTAEGLSESAYIFTRSTEFNEFEMLYNKRRCLVKKKIVL
jgi:RimJ/RimL family protein N-acetyltransferase